MGIRDFAKVFAPEKQVKFGDIKNSTIAIDAYLEMYRTSLGMSSVTALTDSNGCSTVHINILLANMITYQQNKICQIWVFDHDSNADNTLEFHNPLKMKELERRKSAKIKAKKAIDELDEEAYLFGDDDHKDDQKDQVQMLDTKSKPSKESLEKRCFTLNQNVINDLKFMLACLDITWFNSPAGYESEQICACLTQLPAKSIYRADHVLSQDTDALVFGAKTLIKKNIKDKKYYIYYLDQILEKIPESNQEIDDLIKIAIILGCDFAKKTPQVGPKRVFKKYKDVILTEEQLEAFKLFKKPCPKLDQITYYNQNEIPFQNMEKINILIDWLVRKNFNRIRVTEQLAKVVPALK